MIELHFASFETAIGRCGIVWSERGIVAVRFPAQGENAVRNRIAQRFPHAHEAAPPEKTQRAIDDIVALLGGEPRDLRHIEVDLGDTPDFNRRVTRGGVCSPRACRLGLRQTCGGSFD
jgi:methylated-DNA-[protein]-cysteine S-methyltransferase